MKQFIKQSVKDWKRLNNQNDPTAWELMKRNKQKYGVPIRKQFIHGLNAFWILPLAFVLVKLGDLMGVGKNPNPTGNDVLISLIWVGIVIYGIVKLVKELEKTDPVEKVKQDARPKLVMPQSGTLPSRAKLIVTDDGKVFDLEGKHVSTLS